MQNYEKIIDDLIAKFFEIRMVAHDGISQLRELKKEIDKISLNAHEQDKLFKEVKK